MEHRTIARTPANVPPELVVDFDYFAVGAKGDPQGEFAELQKGPDIVWTPYYGGHWIATRAADFDVMHIDHEHFSHRQFDLPRNPNRIQSVPLGLDPPEHTPYRRLLMTAFTPQKIRAYSDVARDTARELVREIGPRGECEFIEDFARILPIVVFLTMMGLPLEDRTYLLPLAHVAVHSNDAELKTRTQQELAGYLMRHLEPRRAKPGDDLLSAIVHGEIGGRPINQGEIMSMALLALVGGLDTVASQLGFIANFLANSPAHRRQLIDNPRIIPVATEELLRRFGLPNTLRELTVDYDYKNIRFRQNDLILLPKCLYGLDDRINERPFEVDFTRKPSSIRHAAFGAGPHICAGNVLARREIIIFLEEWLPAIPDFATDPDRPPQFSAGGVNCVNSLHLKWDA